MVQFITQLERSSCNSSGLCGFPDLRRGQSKTTKIHQQTWQVGNVGPPSGSLCNEIIYDAATQVKLIVFLPNREIDPASNKK